MTLSRGTSGRAGIAFLVVGLLVSACGSTKPSVAEWESDWNAVMGLIPDQSFLDDDPTELCETVLVSLREAEGDLFPTPDELIDESVRTWLEVAEGIFFDCPPADGFSTGYEQLDELEAAIDAGLSSLDE